MEGTGLVAEGDEVTRVNQHAKSWSRLDPEICDMIWGKLPHLERLRLRCVCKQWNCGALQRLEPKPYLVSIVKKEYETKSECIGVFKYDALSKNLRIIEPIVTIRLGSPYRVLDGLIFCEHPKDKKEWCVYNIHTRMRHIVPLAPGSGEYISGMVVDTSVKPYTFKLVASYSSSEETQIYNSTARSWSSHAKSNQHSHSSVRLPRNDELFLTLCHKGSMYMSNIFTEGRVFVYSMEEDQWKELSGFPFLGCFRPYLGAWDDRIFAVVRDIVRVIVWELVDVTQGKWVEYARWEQLRLFKFPLYECDFMSIFCEEYVLMQNWNLLRLKSVLLFNLKTREWSLIRSKTLRSYNI